VERRKSILRSKQGLRRECEAKKRGHVIVEAEGRRRGEKGERHPWKSTHGY